MESVEVLVITMNADSASLINKMRITGNATIANQSNSFYVDEINNKGKTIRIVTTATRGASLNRNIAFELSTGSIIVFCDDDVCLSDNYERIILQEFENHPNVDAIKFYCESTNINRPLAFKKPKKFTKATRRFATASKR